MESLNIYYIVQSFQIIIPSITISELMYDFILYLFNSARFRKPPYIRMIFGISSIFFLIGQWWYSNPDDELLLNVIVTGLIWILCIHFEILHSPVEENPNLGLGLAWSYWNGFLEHFVKHLDKNPHLFDEFENKFQEHTISCKAIHLIIPKSCDFPKKLSREDNWIHEISQKDEANRQIKEFCSIPISAEWKRPNISIKLYRIYSQFDEVTTYFNFPMSLKTGLGKESLQARKLNTESFVETIKTLVKPYKNVDVHFVYVNDEIEGIDRQKIYAQTLFDHLKNEELCAKNSGENLREIISQDDSGSGAAINTADDHEKLKQD